MSTKPIIYYQRIINPPEVGRGAHLVINQRNAHTSSVVAVRGSEIETANSIYKPASPEYEASLSTHECTHTGLHCRWNCQGFCKLSLEERERGQVTT